MTSCTTCGASGQPEGARFCFSCGASMAAPACVSCRAEIVAGARFCSVCGSAQPGSDVAVASGQSSSRRVTSVLFGDLVGFTTLSESRDQEDVRELLSAYFEQCRQVIARYGGTVEKFIGDAVMAVWGVPTAHEDDAERAVRAGLELVNAVAAMGGDLGVPDLAMRVGIVTGEVAVTVGAEHQGMVAGDAVNTAARVQSAATPGQVWVDETTRLLTSSAITYVDAGSHALKGKAEPMPLWSVRAVVAAVGGLQRADGLEAPHVGREREMRVAKEVFHGAEETGRPAILVVVGEPGVGKSRLAWEFEKYVDGLRTPVRWHGGRCLSYGEGVAFYAVAEAVRGRLQAPGDDGDAAYDTDDQAEMLARALDRFSPDAEERAWLSPRLGTLLGLGVTGSFAREDLFAAWTTFFERVSGDDREPVVLVVDDAQYADDGTLAFLEHLLAVASFPAFVVLLTRPGLLEERPTLATNRRATVLHLETLPPAQMTQLLDGLVANLPDDVRRSLVQRAEGVPVFAVETVRSLIDRDLVVPRGGQYVLADPDRLDLDAVGAPASLQALIAARLDTLAPEQRVLVDRASVLGESFTRDAVAALCPEVDSVDAALAALVRAQLLQQESSRLSSELGKYLFVQSAVRAVAYGTLARRERKALHLQVAEQLRDGDRDEALTAIAAQHYLEAIDAVPDAPDVPTLTATAVACLLTAGRRAAALGAPSEAVGHLGAALSRETDEEGSAGIRLELAAALRSAGRPNEAVENATATLAFYEGRDELRAGAAAHVLGQSLVATGDHERAAELTQAHYQRLRDRPDAVRVCYDLTGVLAIVNYRLGRPAVDVAQARARLAARLDDRAAQADALMTLALHFTAIGLDMVSVLLYEEAGRIALALHDSVTHARALTNIAAIAVQDDLEHAVAAGEAAREAARGVGDAAYVVFSSANQIAARLLQGGWDDLDGLYVEELEGIPEQSMAELARTWTAHARGGSWQPPEDLVAMVGDDATSLGYAQGALARSLASSGRGEEALRLAVESTGTTLSVSGMYDDFTVIWTNAVDIARTLGAWPELRGLRELVEQHPDNPPTGIKTGCAWVRAAEAAHEDLAAEEVEQRFTLALDLADRWHSATLLARIRADQAVWLERTGRHDEAAEVATAARETYRSLGAEGWTRALDEALDRTRV